MTLQDLIGRAVDGIQLDGNSAFVKIGTDVLVMNTSAGCDHIHVYLTKHPITMESMLQPICLPCKPYVVQDMPMFSPFVAPLPSEWALRKN